MEAGGVEAGGGGARLALPAAPASPDALGERRPRGPWMRFPIQTDRLAIRPFTLDDADEVHAIWSDPEVMRWIPSGPLPSVAATREKIRRFMDHQAAHGFSLWAVCEKASGAILGDCGLLLTEWKGPEVELAYRFSRAVWGQGFASEAAAACLRYGFEVLGLERIIAVTDPAHVASRRVMEKAGLGYVGMASYYGMRLVKYAAERELFLSGARPAAMSLEQAAFLERQRSGRLATVDPTGQPHVVPICYALLDGRLYTPIDEKPKSGDPRALRRLRNIQANPKVCLVVDEYDDEDWSRLAWLQVRGQAALVEDEAERTRALAALRERYRQYRAMALEGLPLLRITPTRLVGWRATPLETPA